MKGSTLKGWKQIVSFRVDTFSEKGWYAEKQIGPVVQSIFSLTSSLVVKILTF